MNRSLSPNEPTQPAKLAWLVKPTYGHVGPSPKRPTTKEVIVEWFDAVSFWKDSTRLLPAFYLLYHFATFAVFVYFLVHYFSILAVVSVALIGSFIGTVYNTVWYHRYCSHQAFRFRSVWFARLFLWTNPISFREESYVIPHRVHHSKSDEPGDPYGPHLGWLGSYLATETQQKMNRNITSAEYDRLASSLGHIGLIKNSYAQFQRTGSVENVGCYFARVLVANIFWSAIGYAVAGVPGVLAFIAGNFLFAFVVRDFNYRGHASMFGTDKEGAPVNQVIYGIIAGEWHENHHDHPRLARSGLVWWQVDVPYYIILAMRSCGVVTQYNKEIVERG
ncbi:MAG TPA: fatty acid desaturase [Verrucomicrobiae bacterium]|jgi:stearoyl-CoA desaturase (delta-9 desaturase)|nr:fatty acid desaturase [Verrucomicrobiae bacterium]